MSDPQHSIETLYAVGHWLLTAERFNDAAIVFRTMALAAPGDERVWLALGACHEGIGQLQIAASLYEVGGTVAAPAIRCAIARGRSLRALGNDADADLAFEQARALAEDRGDDELAAVAATELRLAS